jgi:hypothetical protein
MSRNTRTVTLVRPVKTSAMRVIPYTALLVVTEAMRQ